jgi:hypothetical protein
MYSLASVRQQPSVFLSLTALQPEEFNYLLTYFSTLWQEYHQQYDLKGKRRVIPKFKVAKNSSLPAEEDKLFFILCYLKNNALQTFTGFAFGLSRAKTSQWIKVLLPLLEKSLKQAKQLPVRSQEQLDKALQSVKEKIFWVDATERPLPRSTDKDNQQEDYSGKSHQHAVKNTLLTDSTGRVQWIYTWRIYGLHLSGTFEGRCHDKRMLDEEPIRLPKDAILFQDLGYLGHQPEDVFVAMPEKKPKNKALSPLQKATNQLVNSFRVSVEPVISGVKRLRIVKDTLRLKGDAVRDQVMLLACGLHNLRVSFRSALG